MKQFKLVKDNIKFYVKYDGVLDGKVHPQYEMKQKLTRKSVERVTTKTMIYSLPSF